ncbi:MAG TPA: tRNA (adenosine(37)-N6)-threonylcarbamoyltransferase complex ATPase subunit type 1 TsaE [Candidatus Hydrogenedentes bacterium]|nr:tRNA (adenosine(37)-N6)-threonylcarbamoyltransferase complex ATPase subunit type 1 TsaE [Candidatus Hydrogenedentota bacterium]HQM99569.1 tRNA (adenosine(37)-N6)-threonylcarbamoyltransferase complex ATPase subunit type 1 TsaE [Candidatus Hydrogenedentota bacterium]
MDSLTCVTRRVEETEALGTRLAALLVPGAVVALHGDLATGKTCLTRGMARHFTGNATVHSPTFTLVNEYGHDRILYHLDLYRLRSAEELLTLGYEDIIETDGICVIEWADRAAGFLPDRRIDVFLEHGGGDTRLLRFENHCLDDEPWSAFAEEIHRMGLT